MPLLLLELELLKVALISVQAFVSTECCPDSSRKPLRTDASAPDLVQFLKSFTMSLTVLARSVCACLF